MGSHGHGFLRVVEAEHIWEEVVLAGEERGAGDGVFRPVARGGGDRRHSPCECRGRGQGRTRRASCYPSAGAELEEVELRRRREDTMGTGPTMAWSWQHGAEPAAQMRSWRRAATTDVEEPFFS